MPSAKLPWQGTLAARILPELKIAPTGGVVRLIETGINFVSCIRLGGKPMSMVPATWTERSGVLTVFELEWAKYSRGLGRFWVKDISTISMIFDSKCIV